VPEILEKIGPNYVKEQMMTFNENRTYLFQAVQSIPGLSAIFPKGTFYMSILIDLNRFEAFKSDQAFIQAFLTEENVSTMPLSVFCNG